MTATFPNAGAVKPNENNRVFWLGLGILYLSLIPFLFRLSARMHDDVRLYYEVTEGLLSGVLPYRDRTFEYPPYVLIWLLIPALGGSLENFRLLFAGEILVIDIAVKAWLLVAGLRCQKGFHGLIPLAFYAVGAGFLNFFYLQRLDLIPAALSLALLVAFNRERFFWAGVLLALGTGTKVYPILFGLPLLILAWRQGAGLKSFLLGNAAGFAPLLLASFVVPWWRFLAFHADRGFEVESLWASLLWAAHHFREVEAEWSWVRAWMEVKGPAAEALLPWAKGIFLGAVVLSWAAVSTALAVTNGTGSGGRVPRAAKSALEVEAPWNASFRSVAGIFLAVLLPFVAFNLVLSPQYMVWLLVLAATGCLGQKRAPMIALLLATVVTPVWYPSREFSTGFNGWQTTVLLMRNLLLIGVWLVLLVEQLRVRGAGCGVGLRVKKASEHEDE